MAANLTNDSSDALTTHYETDDSTEPYPTITEPNRIQADGPIAKPGRSGSCSGSRISRLTRRIRDVNIDLDRGLCACSARASWKLESRVGFGLAMDPVGMRSLTKTLDKLVTSQYFGSYDVMRTGSCKLVAS